jgi:hypothetical protein
MIGPKTLAKINDLVGSTITEVTRVSGDPERDGTP